MIFVEESRGARRWLLGLGFGGIGVLYLFLFVLPMLYMIAVSFGGGSVGVQQEMGSPFSAYSRFWGDSYYRGIMYTSLRLGFATVVVSLVLALPLAYLAANGSKLYRTLTLIAVLSPLFVSTIVRAFGLELVLKWVHMDETFLAVLTGCVQILLPFMVLPLMTGFREIDPLVVHSARTLGSGRFRIAFQIVLPVLAPSLLAGSVLVLVLTLNIFSIPLILGRPEKPTVALVIYQSALTHANYTFASAVAMIMLATALLLIWSQGRLVRSGARGGVL